MGLFKPKDRKNVFICVNGEKYSWKEGEGVVFDDTYPHKVYNNTDQDRVVLYIDVERSHMPNYLTLMNKKLLKLLSTRKSLDISTIIILF